MLKAGGYFVLGLSLICLSESRLLSLRLEEEESTREEKPEQEGIGESRKSTLVTLLCQVIGLVAVSVSLS